MDAALSRLAGQTTAHRMQWMDALRGVAACAVVVQHYYWPLIPTGISRYLDPGIIGVVAFFCISGLVIPQSVMGRKRPTAIQFAALRAFRLYPAYWLSLIVGVWAAASVSAQTVLINATMMQRFVGVADVVGVYWTLQIELIFYVVMGLLIAARKVDNPRVAAWLTAVALCGAALLSLARHITHLKVPVAPAFGSAVIFSSLLYYHHRNNGFLSHRAFATLAVAVYLFLSACFFWAYATNWGFDENPWRFVLCYGIGIGLFAAFQALNLRSPVLVWLGQISYPLYLLHKPLGEIIGRIWDGPAWLAPLLSASLLLILATLVHEWVEKPFVRLGRRFCAVG